MVGIKLNIDSLFRSTQSCKKDKYLSLSIQRILNHKVNISCFLCQRMFPSGMLSNINYCISNHCKHHKSKSENWRSNRQGRSSRKLLHRSRLQYRRLCRQFLQNICYISYHKVGKSLQLHLFHIHQGINQHNIYPLKHILHMLHIHLMHRF